MAEDGTHTHHCTHPVPPVPSALPLPASWTLWRKMVHTPITAHILYHLYPQPYHCPLVGLMAEDGTHNHHRTHPVPPVPSALPLSASWPLWRKMVHTTITAHILYHLYPQPYHCPLVGLYGGRWYTQPSPHTSCTTCTLSPTIVR